MIKRYRVFTNYDSATDEWFGDYEETMKSLVCKHCSFSAICLAEGTVPEEVNDHIYHEITGRVEVVCGRVEVVCRNGKECRQQQLKIPIDTYERLEKAGMFYYPFGPWTW